MRSDVTETAPEVPKGEPEKAAPEDSPLTGKPETETRAATQESVPESLQRPFDIRSFALTGLFILAVFYTMYVVRSILLPLVLALLLSYLFRPGVRALNRIRIRPPIGAAILLIAAVATVGYGVSYLATPAAGWLEKAPYGVQQLKEKLLPLRKPIEQVAQASGEIDKLTSPEQATAGTTTVQVKQGGSMADSVYTRTPEILVSTALLLILLYFLLVYDAVFLGKLLRLMPRVEDRKRALSIASEIESHVSKYLLTITIINIGLGIAVGTAVGLLGLRNAIMWGALAAVLNFVPYIGALTGIVCMTIGAVLSFDSLGYAMLFPAVYFAITTIEGSFVTPWVMGRSLTLNPVIILLSLTFWGFMWGIAGVILAVPILSAFKIFCAHIEELEPVADFLS